METPEKCVLSLFNVNTKDTKTTSSDVFVVNFEQFNFEHIDPLFPLLTLNKQTPAGIAKALQVFWKFLVSKLCRIGMISEKLGENPEISEIILILQSFLDEKF